MRTVTQKGWGIGGSWRAPLARTLARALPSAKLILAGFGSVLQIVVVVVVVVVVAAAAAPAVYFSIAVRR